MWLDKKFTFTLVDDVADGIITFLAVNMMMMMTMIKLVYIHNCVCMQYCCSVVEADARSVTKTICS